MTGLQTANEAIDELTALRQADARRHGAEIVELLREKAATVLFNEEVLQKLRTISAAVEVLTGENDSLKAERDRAQKESKRLLRKVATLQDQVNGVDEKEEAVVNHFDSREHHEEI